MESIEIGSQKKDLNEEIFFSFCFKWSLKGKNCFLFSSRFSYNTSKYTDYLNLLFSNTLIFSSWPECIYSQLYFLIWMGARGFMATSAYDLCKQLNIKEQARTSALKNLRGTAEKALSLIWHKMGKMEHWSVIHVINSQWPSHYTVQKQGKVKDDSCLYHLTGQREWFIYLLPSEWVIQNHPVWRNRQAKATRCEEWAKTRQDLVSFNIWRIIKSMEQTARNVSKLRMCALQQELQLHEGVINQQLADLRESYHDPEGPTPFKSIRSLKGWNACLGGRGGGEWPLYNRASCF